MRFVPVDDVLVAVWPVRVRDFQAFAEATGLTRVPLEFTQEDTHPAVNVNWEDARAFCQWLTEREIKSEQLGEGQSYRMPTDAEWSVAAGGTGEGGATP